MITTLYIVRHGETEGSDIFRYKGSIDVSLSEKGKQQTKRASLLIKGDIESRSSSKYLSYLRDIQSSIAASTSQLTQRPQLKAIYCSNLQRAIGSAEIIAEPYGLQPVKTAAFRERNFGIWEGMALAAIKEKYHAEFDAWVNDPLRYSPTEGETTPEVRDRIIPALNRILSDHKGENIAVVAHGGVNRIMLCHFLGIPMENIFRIEQDYAAVNIIELWEKYPVVRLLNGKIDI
jgi:alpha-ribazole phosphatase